MNCEKTKKLLLDYLQNELPDNEKQELAEHLERCETCEALLEEFRELDQAIENRTDMDPPPSLKENFNRMLVSEMERQVASRQVSLSDRFSSLLDWFSIKPLVQSPVTILLMVLCFTLGYYFNNRQDETNLAARSLEEIERLQVEMKTLKDAYLINSLSLPRPGQRLQAIVEYGSGDSMSAAATDALLRFFEDDNNVNVRLTALQKLDKYLAGQEIRSRLLDSISNEKEPLMQVSIIRIFLEAGDARIVPKLESIIFSEETTDYVKGYALDAKSKLERRSRAIKANQNLTNHEKT